MNNPLDYNREMNEAWQKRQDEARARDAEFRRDQQSLFDDIKNRQDTIHRNNNEALDLQQAARLEAWRRDNEGQLGGASTWRERDDMSMPGTGSRLSNYPYAGQRDLDPLPALPPDFQFNPNREIRPSITSPGESGRSAMTAMTGGIAVLGLLGAFFFPTEAKLFARSALAFGAELVKAGTEAFQTNGTPQGIVREVHTFSHSSTEIYAYGEPLLRTQSYIMPDTLTLYVHWDGERMLVNNKQIDPIAMNEDDSRDYLTKGGGVPGIYQNLKKCDPANIRLIIMEPSSGRNQEEIERQERIVHTVENALDSGRNIAFGVARFKDGHRHEFLRPR